MLLVLTKGNSEDFPCLYHPINAQSAHTLHCLGKKLSLRVRAFFISLIFLSLLVYLSASFLVCSQLFGEDEDAASQTELDAAQAQGENAKEIEALRREAMAFGAVRKALRVEGATSGEEAAKLAFSKVEDVVHLHSIVFIDVMSFEFRSFIPTF